MAFQILKPVALGVAAAIILVLLSWQSFFEQVNNIAYDFTQRLAGERPPTSGVLIVAIDEESLDRVGAVPWPRNRLAELIEDVDAGAPAAVGIDILLDDPGAPEEDRVLADVLGRSRNLVLPARVDEGSGTDLRWLLPLEEFHGDGVRLGHVHADADLDSVMRRVVTAKNAQGRVLRAFSMEVLDVAGMLPAAYNENLGGAVRIQTEQLRIRFVGDRGAFQQVPAWEVLTGSVDPGLFRDRIVLIGVTAEASGDDWMTPFSVSGRPMSGIEVHANALESIYSGRNIREVPEWIVLIALAGLILGLRWIERRFEGFRFYLASVATIPAVVAVSWLLMNSGFWLPFPTFILGVALTVPTLGVRKLVKVNRNLDRKISRLSVWAAESGMSTSPLSALRTRLDAELEDPDLKRQWLDVLNTFEHEREGRSERRERLLAKRRHDAPWKLDAVDYFNEQLYRFVSFNDSVLAGIEDVIIVSDPAGQVVYQNTAARNLQSFSDEPPVLWDYLSSLLDGRSLIESFARVVTLDETFHAEMAPSSTASRFYTLTISPIPRIGVIATLHDVTAQHQLDQAKNDMVSLVSHELRTPLTSIRGYGDMLARYGLVEEKGQDFLQSIQAESARLNDLIQSFLDVASIESGRRKLDVTEFEIEPLVNELLSSLEPVAQAKRIVLENAVPPDAGVMRADRVLLYQALANLVANAIKYSPEETAVRVELDNTDRRVCFRVVDRGHGIPPEDVRRIFEKFYRRSNEETRSETGFGLGLPFVRQVAEQHRGGVAVESEVGNGSVFSLWIPAR